ncbi:MAG: DUF2752 domain-containing protein [Marinilabiliales bacterium]|nr:DUF2752 domain-containing protein [Marinilabiliales bacterium]
MPISKNRLYLFLTFATLAGYLWLGFHYLRAAQGAGVESVCLIHRVTGYPCPACGTSRSILALLAGDWMGALLINPLGILMMGAMIVLPFWVALDLIRKKETLYRFYLWCEIQLRRPRCYLPLLLLLILNWIWNLKKGL